MKLITLFLFASLGFAQENPTPPPSEEDELNAAVAEAGSSPIEFQRALEKHLEKYPNSPRRAELERALVKAAIENKDNRRIILYGERVLARGSDDLQVLDRVTRALLSSDARDTSERALKYAKRYEGAISKLRTEDPPGRATKAQWQDELDRGVGRALVLEARATGNLGNMDGATALAARSYEMYPSAEAAREIGRWLAKAGKAEDAIPHIADAFTISDPRVTDEERAADRARMGELYRKLKGSEKGLGDLILEAYDRTSALTVARNSRLRERDPNSQANSPMEFTLSGVAGQKLQLSTLKGKTVVFDFWATWCGPCRAQHPLYEEVKKRFRDAPDVVFLSVNTDENKAAVEPFLKEQKWDGKVYFESGLSRALEIASIPTTIIVDRRGQVVSRMNGFVPSRFVDMLSERIRDAAKN
ncbi:MAG: TlpA family protein disulfide reductase [Acidobacteria bacterium]|nr:TlpA family protein disulfide reductase [Acidobacteriota bacterium]